eukprot:362098_1
MTLVRAVQFVTFVKKEISNKCYTLQIEFKPYLTLKLEFVNSRKMAGTNFALQFDAFHFIIDISIIFISLISVSLCIIPDELLTRHVSSIDKKIFDIDDNGNCYYPPFCKLDTSQCNIDKIPYQ